MLQFFSFENLRFELDYISLQSVVYFKQTQVLDSAREYCELIGLKGYHSCVDTNEIVIAFLSIYYSVCHLIL